MLRTFVRERTHSAQCCNLAPEYCVALTSTRRNNAEKSNSMPTEQILTAQMRELHAVTLCRNVASLSKNSCKKIRTPKKKHASKKATGAMHHHACVIDVRRTHAPRGDGRTPCPVQHVLLDAGRHEKRPVWWQLRERRQKRTTLGKPVARASVENIAN